MGSGVWAVQGRRGLEVPAKTAAMLGGWKKPATMQRLYQQPTGQSLYAASMEVGKSGGPSRTIEKCRWIHAVCGGKLFWSGCMVCATKWNFVDAPRTQTNSHANANAPWNARK
jgi:hypothetical protein